MFKRPYRYLCFFKASLHYLPELAQYFSAQLLKEWRREN